MLFHLPSAKPGPLGNLGIAEVIETNGEEYLALPSGHAPHRMVKPRQFGGVDRVVCGILKRRERPLQCALAAGGHCPASPQSCANCRRKSAALLAALAARKIAFSSSRNTASQEPI